MADSLLHVRDRTGERTLRLPEDSILRILAAVRDDTDSLEEALKEAERHDASASPRLATDAREEVDRPQAPFRLDLLERRIVFPADRVRFARRGVLARRDVDGRVSGTELSTYRIGRSFRLVDAADNRELDRKAEARSEKAMWSAALPPNVDEARGFRLDGNDVTSEALRDIYVWSVTNDERAPEVGGQDVYTFRMEGPRHATLMGQAHDAAPRGEGPGSSD